MYEHEKERNYFSMIEAESIIKILSATEIDEDNLKKMKIHADRLKRIIDRCIQNIEERGPDDGQSH